MQSVNSEQQKWLDLLGQPSDYNYEKQSLLIRSFQTSEYSAEIYEQANGPGTTQQVLLLIPADGQVKHPAVVVPFYYPDKTVGLDLETLEPLADQGAALALFLVLRGYVVITAESFHLTYTEQDRSRDDFTRWAVAADALLHDHLNWTGMGKLVADTQLLIDLLEEDPRVDATRIGIAGHSLGGKIAMYTACLDQRIQAMLCSDFGLKWEASNWDERWYWGEKLESIKAADLDHSHLLAAGGLKPITLLAGLYDDASALTLLEKVGYKPDTDCLFINHASGHRPPRDVLDQGFEFLDKFLNPRNS